MFNFKNSLLAATVLLAIPQIAQAQPITGIYIGAGGGFNFLDSEHIRASSMPVPVGGVHTSYQPGWAALGSVGYGFGNGFRVEVEGNYRTNHLRSNTMISGRSSSSEDKYGAMLNALYDFNTMDVGMDGVGISPYLGLGAGWAHNKWNNTTVQDAGGRIGINNGMDTAAYQGIAGLAFPIAAVPGLAITAEYRLIDTPGSRKYDSLYTRAGFSSSGQTTASRDLNQSAMLGLRYALNSPAAAAPEAAPPPVMSATPAAAPSPSRSYLVFFDWDRADLSVRATQIIADAAQNVTKVQYTKIDVQGHADLTGTHEYNQGLSLRRANAVSQLLVKDGVPETAIVVTALGDTKPLIPTAPGVREPQNRRVEIMIH